MGIYIKGMEMPSKKNGAVIILYPDGMAAFEDGTKYQAMEVLPHDRLIDADVLMRKFELIDWHSANKKGEMVEGARSEKEAYIKYTDAECAINDAPTIIEGESGCTTTAPTTEVVKREIGKWVFHDDGCLAYRCSACGKYAYGCFPEVYTGEYRYCPHCGARMARI